MLLLLPSMLLVAIPGHDDQTFASVPVRTLWVRIIQNMSESAFDLEMHKRMVGRVLVSIYHVTFRIGDVGIFLSNFRCDSTCFVLYICGCYSVRCFHGYHHICIGREGTSS